MRPDAATDAFLDALKSAGGKPLWEITIDEARSRIRGASLQLAGPLADVRQVTDRRIAVPGGEIGLRLYTPHGAGPLFPIVVHFHGAGFVAGDLDTHDAIARAYCRHAEAVVISVDYRLAPEHRFPVAAEDSYAAVAWAAARAAEFHGDPARIAVTGDSAGGNLAAVVCQLAKARGGPAIIFQALVYPVVDFRLDASYPSRTEFGGGDYFLSTRDMEFFRSCYLADVARQSTDPAASPLFASDLSRLPPALVVTAGCDPLRDEGKAYADRLAAAGVPVEYHCFEQAIHAFMSFAAAIPAAADGTAFVGSRLRAAFTSPAR